MTKVTFKDDAGAEATVTFTSPLWSATFTGRVDSVPFQEVLTRGAFAAPLPEEPALFDVVARDADGVPRVAMSTPLVPAACREGSLEFALYPVSLLVVRRYSRVLLRLRERAHVWVRG